MSPQQITPQPSSVIPGDKATYPRNSMVNSCTRLEEIPSMGKGLIATKDLPAGTTWFIATVDNYFTIPQKTFSAIRVASKKYPEWKLFKQSIEMVTVYRPSWNTLNFSLDNLRFLNHGIEKGEGDNGEGNTDIGGTIVAEDTLVGLTAWTTRDVKQGEHLVINYHGFKKCPWATCCDEFLKAEGDKVDYDALDNDNEFDGPVEILLTRGQFEVYVQSGLERDIDKALLMVIVKWGVWDDGGQLWAIRVPVEA